MNRKLRITFLVVSIVETILMPILGITPLVLSIMYPNVPEEKKKKTGIWIITLTIVAFVLIVAACIYILKTTIPLM